MKILILINDDIALIRKIRFDRTESWSGSKVPLLEGKIEFLQAILRMLNSLPNVLKYSEHIDLFEQKIILKKKEIIDEQKSDFQEGTFY